MPRYFRNALVLCLMLATISSGPSADAQTTEEAPGNLLRFVREYVHNEFFPTKETVRYVDISVDLNDDDHDEVIVYFVSPFCGSGGCHMLVIGRQGPSYKVLTDCTIVSPPIKILERTSNGWHNLSVVVRDGGRSYTAELTYDGASYPSNPSVPPARRISLDAKGTILIPSEIRTGALKSFEY